jgi:hypothetical protein
MILHLTYSATPIKGIVSMRQTNDAVSGAMMFRFLTEEGTTFILYPDEIRSIEIEVSK